MQKYKCLGGCITLLSYPSCLSTGFLAILQQQATMKLAATLLLLASTFESSFASPAAHGQTEAQALYSRNKHLRPVLEKRQSFDHGQPINANGNGAPLLGKLYSINH